MQKACYDDNGMYYKVWLDGVELNNCAYANEEKGVVLCYVTNHEFEKDHLPITDKYGNAMLVEKYGDVMVIDIRENDATPTNEQEGA